MSGLVAREQRLQEAGDVTAFLHKEAPVFVQLAALEIRTGCAQGGTSRLECPRPPPCEEIETQWLED